MRLGVDFRVERLEAGWAHFTFLCMKVADASNLWRRSVALRIWGWAPLRGYGGEPILSKDHQVFQVNKAVIRQIRPAAPEEAAVRLEPVLSKDAKV